MKRFKEVAAIFCVSLVALVLPIGVNAAPVAPQALAYSSTELFSPDQLDNLLAPIALYPDPLLAQVLPASTFVDQVDESARWLRANNDRNFIDEQPWDISVRAVAHYPSVLFMMADKIDWTTSLGQAYVYQSTDVMTSIQRLRAMARNAGNLVSNQQQQVIAQGNYIRIDPYQPQYIYVPVYDPSIIYYRHSYGGGFGGSFISFGAGFFIGAWLNNDFDWGGHRVYYHGWQGEGWIGRSRPNVRINNIYVNNTYTNIQVNRTVINNNVNYSNLDHYNSVHREVNYNNVAQNRQAVVGTSGNQVSPGIQVNRENQRNPGSGNKVINRNVNTNDARIDAYRGRQPQQQPTTTGTTPAQTTQARPSTSQVAQPQSLPQGRPTVRETQVTPQITQPAPSRETRQSQPVAPEAQTPARQNERPTTSQVIQPSSLPQQGRPAARETQATPQITQPAPSRETRQSQPVAPEAQTPARQNERPTTSQVIQPSSLPQQGRPAARETQATPKVTGPAPSRETRQSQPVAPAAQTPARQNERPPASSFKVSKSPVDSQAASQRGQASRTQAVQQERKPAAGASSKPENHSTTPATEKEKGHKQN